MKELNFYSNKLLSFLLLLVSLVSVIVGIFFGKKLINFEKNLFESIILILFFLLFTYGLVFSILLLTRKKPLLSITNSQIIIYSVWTSSKTIEIENIQSFFILNHYHRGTKTSSRILIELKEPKEKYLNMKFDISPDRINNPIVNPLYSIKTVFLGVKQEKLLKILNEKIKTVE